MPIKDFQNFRTRRLFDNEQESVYVANGNPGFFLFLHLTDVHFRLELQHVGDVNQQKIKCQPIRTREIGGVSLSDVLYGRTQYIVHKAQGNEKWSKFQCTKRYSKDDFRVFVVSFQAPFKAMYNALFIFYSGHVFVYLIKIRATIQKSSKIKQKQPPELFYKKTILKNFAIFTKKLRWLLLYLLETSEKKLF